MCTRALIFATILASIAYSAGAEDAADRCPKLPAASGFKWQYSRGPDFGVCYGEKNGDSPQLIGVYLGFAPNFQPDPKRALRDGKIGADVVHWYKKQPQEKAYKVGAETLYTHGPSTSHIWLLAQDERSLSDLISLAESLAFTDAK
jgi:hypothetical protein